MVRFMRALWIMTVPKILKYLNVLQTSNAIHMAQLLAYLVGFWLSSAGFVHLVETSGDPFNNWENNQYLSYWECLYFLVITMSTVGYGDVTCVTVIGKSFIIIFIIGSMYLFARNIDVIVQIIGKAGNNNCSYKKPAGVKHLVIVGSITYYSVKNFVDEFLHVDWQQKNLTLIFLNKQKPDLRTYTIFKKNFTNVKFFMGTPMNAYDLGRVKLKEAEAFIVMANPYTGNRDEEDASNVLRVIAAKNYHPKIRIIVQLLSYQNKGHLLNLSPWSEDDKIICEDEIKLGFLAQSCVAPGFSTLISNLFVLKNAKNYEKNCRHGYYRWHSNYVTGSDMELYTCKFSESFYEYTFVEAAEICYTMCDLLLIGIKSTNFCGKKRIIMNTYSKHTIGQDSVGFFICRSKDSLRKLNHLCKLCHIDNKMTPLQKCKCRQSKLRLFVDIGSGCDGNINSNFQYEHRNVRKRINKDFNILISDNYSNRDDIFDFTGLFHWCPDVPLEKAIWGSPLNRANLRSVQLDHCRMCVIIKSYQTMEDRILADKESIICTLGIKSMKFYKLVDLEGDSFCCRKMVMKTTASINEEIDKKRKSSSYKMEISSSKVPLITDVECNSNVRFLDVDNFHDPKLPFRMSLPFACGSVFTSSLLDSLLCNTYFNPESINIIRILLTGAVRPELDQMMAEGVGILKGSESTKDQLSKKQCSIHQLSMDTFFKEYIDKTYSEMFLSLLKDYGIICLGLYRQLETAEQSGSYERFVITNPPGYILLQNTDLVYCMVPFKTQVGDEK
ncbi:DgyrCDS7795 [Dimorphilus gyrociliatus]|uniref:BK channel n=1 Tax=Dimorphilus gyrociliatus TaxID=2664684 RepID=A0A7I8VT67_9ANNE|nr:DgyrCDS7795 [Dimorphilus gyrociliatus]